MKLVTYLAFDGQCEAAFKHYEKVLGGKILMLMRGADAPPGIPVPPEARDRIMHARLAVGDELLMGGDAPPGRGCHPQGFSAHIKVDTPADAERIFRELGAGGSVMMPIAESFWARRFGMLTDRFGIPWMVNCEKPLDALETSGTPFVISRTFAASRETLWACFTEPERMQKWWGPKGATIVSPRMDLKVGGRFNYGMRLPDGKATWGRQVFREIAPPDRLVLVNSFADEHGGIARHPLGPTWPLEMHATYAFDDAGFGKTRFTVTWVPIYPTAEERGTFDAGHESMRNGWTGTLDRLEAHLAKV